MNKKTIALLTIGIVLATAWTTPALAHTQADKESLIIDTDMGLDDAVTLAAALQCADVSISAIIACDGASSGQTCARYLNCMLSEFNRSDIVLYRSADGDSALPSPTFRPFVEKTLSAAITQKAKDRSLAFSPKAFRVRRGKSTILALGPLTNIAAAFRTTPEIKDRISKIIIAGRENPDLNWNLKQDQDAYDVVCKSGIKLVFVTENGKEPLPPAQWQDKLTLGAEASVGRRFLRRLLKQDEVREHYFNRLSRHQDELAFLFLCKPAMFAKGEKNEVLPTDSAAAAEALAKILSQGRQQRPRVAFANKPLQKSTLQSDVASRMDSIIALNGQDEWFSQLIMNELHEHLGAYSVIGVKMGLRAAELLNAPQHEMMVITHIKPGPPASCLNDGVIVGAGCTPGRNLFRQGKVETKDIKVTFIYNGRAITLKLKDKYRNHVKEQIKKLLKIYTLDDHGYWEGVRETGFDIWENWHRCDLFEVTEASEDAYLPDTESSQKPALSGMFGLSASTHAMFLLFACTVLAGLAGRFIRPVGWRWSLGALIGILGVLASLTCIEASNVRIATLFLCPLSAAAVVFFAGQRKPQRNEK